MLKGKKMEVEGKKGKKAVETSSSEESEVEQAVVKKQKLNTAEAKKVTKAPDAGILNKKQKAKAHEEDEDVVLLQKKGVPAKGAPAKAAGKAKAKNDSDATSESEEEIVAAAKKIQGKNGKAVGKAPAKMEIEEESSSDEKSKKVVAKAPVKPVAKAPVAAAKGKAKPVSSDDSDDSDAKTKGVGAKPKNGTHVAPAKGKAAPVVAGKAGAKKPLAQDSESDSSDAAPKGAKGKAVPAKGKPAAADSDDSDDSDKPKGKGKPAPVAAKGKAPVKPVVKDDSDEEVSKEDADEEEEKEVATPNKGGDPDAGFEIFVKKLAYKASENDVKQYFSKCGTISNVKILMEPDGRSKGIAFVKFTTEAGQAAGCKLNGAEYMGFPLQIEPAKGKQDRPPRDDGFAARPKSERDPNSTTVFVGGLAYTSTEDSVAEFFGDCGEISHVRIAMDQDGNPRGFCHVEFSDGDAVDKAVAKAGQRLDGRPIRVDFSGAKKDRDDGGFGGGRGGRGGRGGDRGGRGGRGGGRGFGRGSFSSDDKARNKGTGVPAYAGNKTQF